jgi:hypothetical protein
MFALECLENGTPATYEAIAHFINSEMSISISLDALRHILPRHPCLKSAVGIPMEREQVKLDPREIEEFYDRLHREVTGLPSTLNLDETGHQDWADRKDIRVVVPVSYEGDSIYVPWDRSSKRASLLMYIAADGTFVEPMVIVPRLTVEQEVYEIGYDPDRIMLEHQENSFISTQLFDKWATEVFFPHVHDVRRRIGYGGWGILLLDGCSCHHSDDFLDRCHDLGILPIFLPAHSFHLTQPLDVGLFAIHKSAIQRVRPPKWMNSQTAQIMKIFGALRAAATPPNIFNAFKQIGLHASWDRSHGALVMPVDLESARKLDCERTIEESQREQVQINIRP